MGKKYLICIFILVLASNVFANTKKQIQVLEWIDLVPDSALKAYESYVPPEVDHTSQKKAAQPMIFGAVKPELNGRMIKIPGFVVPLETVKQKLTEFLLVPFFGACIHVPPPPPNQIIYVKFPKGASNLNYWDVIYVTGELEVKTVKHDLAQAGYVLKANAIEKYKDS